MLLSRMPDGEPEIFASIQGEGVSVGVPSVFVRLAECNLTCTWCFVPATPVLLADWTWRSIGDLHPGDRVIGIARPVASGNHVKLTEATVTRISRRHAPTVIVNDQLRCTADHKVWLTGRDRRGRAGAVRSGWREVSRAIGMRALFVSEPVDHDDAEYRRGWLAGMADGDGCFGTLRFRRSYRRFRLALNDEQLLARAEAFASGFGYALRRDHRETVGFSGRPRAMAALWLTADERARAFEQWLGDDQDSISWNAGYLGGILDAEGSHSGGVLRIAQYEVDQQTRARIGRVLASLGLAFTSEAHGFYVHRRGGQAWRALALSRPAKRSLREGAFGHHPGASRVIRSVVATNELEEVVTVTTTCGSYVAAGFVVKNCDTKYTWDWANHDRDREVIEIEPRDVAERTIRVAGSGARTVVVTGGEPLLQQEHLAGLCESLRSKGLRIEIETNGAIEPSPALSEHVDQWNVSPKLASSGNRKSARLRAGPLAWFAGEARASFKFVVVTKADVEEVRGLAASFGIAAERIALVPEARDADTLVERSRWLAPLCVEYGFRLGTRLHVQLWGSKRGT